jgi:hypothetical protein
MKEFIKVTAEKWFTKERVDTYCIDSLFYLIIHFPTINITNREQEKHTLHDFYIKFEFSEVCLRSALGMRATTCEGEHYQTYIHSHVQSGWRGDFNSFCFGEILSELYIELKDSFNEEKFELFLASLDEYLEWESIAGTPYRRIRDISKNFSLPRVTNSSNPTQKELKLVASTEKPLGLKLESHSPFNFSTNIDYHTLHLAVQDLKFEDFRYVYEKDGIYYAYTKPVENSTELNKIKTGESTLMFKGSYVPLNTITYTQEFSNLKKVINPYFLTKLKQYIEQEIHHN